MTGLEAWGVAILASLATALAVWIACARYYAPRRLKEHDSWVAGYEAGRGMLNWAERMETRKRLGR